MSLSPSQLILTLKYISPEFYLSLPYRITCGVYRLPWQIKERERERERERTRKGEKLFDADATSSLSLSLSLSIEPISPTVHSPTASNSYNFFVPFCVVAPDMNQVIRQEQEQL